MTVFFPAFLSIVSTIHDEFVTKSNFEFIFDLDKQFPQHFREESRLFFYICLCLIHGVVFLFLILSIVINPV